MNRDDMQARTKAFALRSLALAAALPKTVAGQTLGRQLTKCGTSVGANYRSACRARSRADFVAKLGIVEEEADESVFWMELIMESGMMRKDLVESLHNEAEQLVAIVVASRKTARAGAAEIANRKL